jgi:hypothetical protein
MRSFFEGWYFKQQVGEHSIAFIPTRYMEEGGRRSALLQIITERDSYVVPYRPGELKKERGGLRIRLGDSCFSMDGIHLDVRSGTLDVSGDLRFIAPVRPRYDIMGPFCCVPFMECRHSVFSLYHTVGGTLCLNGRDLNFDGGTGYIEGDRGCSFPKRYIWTQCTFDGGSLMLSVADIPFLGGCFTGIVGFVYLDGHEYRLGSYLGARPAGLGSGAAAIRQRAYTLSAELLDGTGGLLQAPVRGRMSRLIREGLCCRVHYRFMKGARVLLDFVSDKASFENEY